MGPRWGLGCAHIHPPHSKKAHALCSQGQSARRALESLSAALIAGRAWCATPVRYSPYRRCVVCCVCVCGVCAGWGVAFLMRCVTKGSATLPAKTKCQPNTSLSSLSLTPTASPPHPGGTTSLWCCGKGGEVGGGRIGPCQPKSPLSLSVGGGGSACSFPALCKQSGRSCQ